ncbi:kinesin-like protein KIF9 [Cyclospora cayetanensis]|uniref:Kinesin-like protein KIF9 n=1 Tax=Cyclospora cayetanensis TaxID=88456 RepID=A0A6P6RYG2_9EIME|nr:kinesin-like protein KIF9 [Cyclospora cayetanensis]
MAYGQTGAGKTYTMCGSLRSFDLRGIIPRSISSLFSLLEEQTGIEFSLCVSYCEIYSELIFDLLAEGGLEGQTGTELQIQEDSRGGLSVRGLSQRPCGSVSEALNYFYLGSSLRSVSSHGINSQSSRSHCIFTVYIQCKSTVNTAEATKISKLHFVDLAGCERPKKTQTEGVLLKESAFINKSLSFLEMVVVALGEKGREHIPYRSTRLTHLLKDTIGGNSNTCLIANIWPEKEHLEETLSTLRFSLRMMRVANKAVVNLAVDPLDVVKRLEKEVARLKQELQISNALLGKPPQSFEAPSPEEIEEMRKEATLFLNGEQEAIPFSSLRKMEELLHVIRSIFQETTAAIRREASYSGSVAASVPHSENSVGHQGALELAGNSKAVGATAPAKSVKEQSKASQQGSPQGAPSLAPKPVQSELQSTKLNSAGAFHSEVGYEDPSVGGHSLGIDPDQSEICHTQKAKETRQPTCSE